MDSMSDPGVPHAQDVVIASDPAEARRVQEEIERLLRAHQYSDHEIFGVKLALEEALVNAIKHGNHFDRTKKVAIAFTVRPERFDVQITDEGPGFDPEDVPDPTAVENLERPCGRGLMLMRYYMSEVSFRANGCCVAMTKLRNGTQ
jgi:serine/threonine-protein kinase RsbW